MAIGDTWETINTYSFVAGETIITADYENDVVNNLEYLYTHPGSSVNIFTANTNSTVTLSASTNDINIGLSITFTPIGTKVLLIVYYSAERGWDQAAIIADQKTNLAYKLNTGAITYIAQDVFGVYEANGVLYVDLTVNAGVSNTITMYAKNTRGGPDNFYNGRLIVIEKAN